mgnify:CR=1 FL=1
MRRKNPDRDLHLAILFALIGLLAAIPWERLFQ